MCENGVQQPCLPCGQEARGEERTGPPWSPLKAWSQWHKTSNQPYLTYFSKGPSARSTTQWVNLSHRSLWGSLNTQHLNYSWADLIFYSRSTPVLDWRALLGVTRSCVNRRALSFHDFLLRVFQVKRKWIPVLPKQDKRTVRSYWELLGWRKRHSVALNKCVNVHRRSSRVGKHIPKIRGLGRPFLI